MLALLRGINVGGQRLRMDALREPFEALGCRAVRTVLASGNVIFELPAGASRGGVDALRQQLEAACEPHFGFAAPLALLDAAQVDDVIAQWPWSSVDKDPSRQMAGVAAGGTGPAGMAAMRATLTPLLAKAWDPEAVACTDVAVYTWHPSGIHDSPLAKALARATRAASSALTQRNLGTWLKLQAALRGSGPAPAITSMSRA